MPDAHVAPSCTCMHASPALSDTARSLIHRVSPSLFAGFGQSQPQQAASPFGATPASNPFGAPAFGQPQQQVRPRSQHAYQTFVNPASSPMRVACCVGAGPSLRRRRGLVWPGEALPAAADAAACDQVADCLIAALRRLRRRLLERLQRPPLGLPKALGCVVAAAQAAAACMALCPSPACI